MALLADLNSVLRGGTGDCGTLVLHYQPIISVATRTLCGVEALVRWQHPRHGLLGPATWLPMTEMSDLIQDLTAWVLDAAIGQAGLWRRQGATWCVKINVSARNLIDPGFPDLIRRVLERHALPSGAIELEVTETAMLADSDRAMAALRLIDGLGIRIAVDDFGAGYSSFAILRRLPALATIKIDQAFVQRMLGNPRDIAVVKNMVRLAHDPGVRSIAEGVEDADTLALLEGIGCLEAQGYHIGRPMTADQIALWCPDAGNPSETGEPSEIRVP